MPHDPYGALYIHIPFCTSRCFYCDFTTEARGVNDSVIDDYVEQIILEIRKLSAAGELSQIRTAYIGGGTPTHIGNSRLSSLLYYLSITPPLDNLSELTVEANPESLTPQMVKDMWALGVNRLSIGVQSFDDEILARMGRAHNADGARNAIAMAQERFENVSIDIMCGIPGQSPESLEKTVGEACSLGVTHVSIYPLQVEQGTPLDKLTMKGQFPSIDPDEQAAHMKLTEELLTSYGYDRYEVASYAKSGFESRHNSIYWSGIPYLGVGKSAVTMTQNAERRMRKQDGVIIDDMNPIEMRAEDLMLAMRMSRGVSRTQLLHAASILPSALDVFDRLVELGLAEINDDRYQPTELGWLCGNELFGRIWELAETTA